MANTKSKVEPLNLRKDLQNIYDIQIIWPLTVEKVLKKKCYWGWNYLCLIYVFTNLSMCTNGHVHCFTC